jgi:TolA-binding protein
MEFIQRFFTIHYPYETTLTRRRANMLRNLDMFAIGLAIAIAINLFLTRNNPEINTGLVLMVPVLLVTSLGTMYLNNQGRLRLASWLYILAAMVGSLVMLYLNGLRSGSQVTLAIPFFVGGLLLARQEVITLTVLANLGLVIIGLNQLMQGQNIEDFWAGVIPPLLLFTFFGIIQWLQVFEFHDSFNQIESSQARLGMFLDLASNLEQGTTKVEKLNHFAQVLQTTLDLQQVQIFLQDENNAQLIKLRGGAGLAALRALMEGRSIYLTVDSLIAEAFNEREPRLVRTTDLANLRTDMLPGSNAQLLIPIIVEGTSIGVLDLQSAYIFAFPPDIIQIAETLGRQLGTILRLHDLEEASIVTQREQEQLYAQLNTNTQELQQLRNQLSGLVWNRFFEDRNIDIIGFDKVAEDADPVPATELTPTLSAALDKAEVEVKAVTGGYEMAIPIALRGQVLGAMAFFIPRKGELPERFIDLGNAVSERLSMALDNARLVEQTRNFAYREQQISQITGQLQNSTTIEDLLNAAAHEFNEAMGSSLTNIRLQLSDAAAVPGQAAPHSNGGDTV